jgi:hypothetical protein
VSSKLSSGLWELSDGAADSFTQPSGVTLHFVTLRYTSLHFVTLRYTTLHYVTLRYVTLRYVHLNVLVVDDKSMLGCVQFSRVALRNGAVGLCVVCSRRSYFCV